MSVLVLGLNYHTAPVGLLERVAVPAEQLPKALASLTAREHVLEAAVLSTCNRVEVYAHISRFHGGLADLRNYFAEWAGLAPEEFVDLTYDYYDDRAAAHLFAVAAGLDSMVLGERQIHLQVRQAFTDADAEGTCGRVLQALFRQALRVGKKARAQTDIAAGASSMVDVGLEAARRVLGDLDGRNAVIVGAGKMGGLAAERLAQTAGRVVVVNRTQERAERLASRIGAEVADVVALPEVLADADVVLTSTGASQPLVDEEVVAHAMARRAERPLALVDLAVPRDVDPSCAIVDGVHVLDIDAIRRLTEDHADDLAGEVHRARALVEAETERFAAWRRSRAVEPTIAALRARAEQVREAELQRLSGRLGELDERQRAAVDAVTRGIINTLLHDPSVRLKDFADARVGEVYATALRELFDLPEHDVRDPGGQDE